jgi:hypothetical protein
MAIKGLVPMLLIVEQEIVPDAAFGLRSVLVSLEIDLLVLHAAPEPLDKAIGYRTRPLPSMLIVIPAPFKTFVKTSF